MTEASKSDWQITDTEAGTTRRLLNFFLPVCAPAIWALSLRCSRHRFTYFEEDHDNLRGQIDILENQGWNRWPRRNVAYSVSSISIVVCVGTAVLIVVSTGV